MVGWRGWMKWFIMKVLWRTMTWSAGVNFTVKGKMASKQEAPITRDTKYYKVGLDLALNWFISQSN